MEHANLGQSHFLLENISKHIKKVSTTIEIINKTIKTIFNINLPYLSINFE